MEGRATARCAALLCALASCGLLAPAVAAGAEPAGVAVSISEQAVIAPPGVAGWRSTAPGRIPFDVRVSGERPGGQVTVHVDRLAGDSFLAGEDAERAIGPYEPDRERRTSTSSRFADGFEVGDQGGFFRIRASYAEGGAELASDEVRVAAAPCELLLPGLVEAGGTCTEGTGLPSEEELDLPPPESGPSELPGVNDRSRRFAPFPECDRSSYGQESGRCESFNLADGPPYRGMLVIPASGGWVSSPEHVDIAVDAGIGERLAEAGWLTSTVELSPGGDEGVESLTQWFDFYRGVFDVVPGFGEDFPVCIWGGSSGGNLALLVGAFSDDVDCIITEAAPTDLEALSDACDANPGGGFCNALYLALAAFGEEGLADASPVNYGPSFFEMPMLLGHIVGDPLVPVEQAQAFADGQERADYYILNRPGPDDPACVSDCYFAHAFGAVSERSLREWRTLEATLLAPEFPDF